MLVSMVQFDIPAGLYICNDYSRASILADSISVVSSMCWTLAPASAHRASNSFCTVKIRCVTSNQRVLSSRHKSVTFIRCFAISSFPVPLENRAATSANFSASASKSVTATPKIFKSCHAEEITCPWHGAQFNVASGKVLGPPARSDVKSFVVTVEGSDVLIELA